MAANQREIYNAQDPHALNDNEHKYIDAMTPGQRQLHELATKMLGSSYFVGKTHGYTKWLKSLTPNTQSQGAK
jgi:hypothetical protein